jgi:hypothetical protein
MMGDGKNEHTVLSWTPLGKVQYEERKGDGRITANGVGFRLSVVERNSSGSCPMVVVEASGSSILLLLLFLLLLYG